MRTLLLLIGLYSLPVMAAAESVPMPASVVLIVCKTETAGPPDQNAEWTHVENRRWATENAMMVCRRQEVQMYDQAADQGAIRSLSTTNAACILACCLARCGTRNTPHPHTGSGALPVPRRLCGRMQMDLRISLPGKCPSAGIATSSCVRLTLKSNQ